jgi:periplasmic protein TonB
MRKLLLCISLLFTLFCCSDLSAQITRDTTIYDQIFSKVEIAPEFPGGVKAWQRFLEKNLDPKIAYNSGAPSGSYRVVVQFIVESDGNLHSLKPLTTHGYGMEEEIIRVMKKSPKWVPGIQNGRQVKCYHAIPVTLIVP